MNRLKQLRNEKRLTIRELGIQTNISYSSISTMENGVRPFTQENLQILCTWFDVSADYLLGISDIPNPKKLLAKQSLFTLYGYEKKLNEEDKNVILTLAKYLAAKNNKEKN